MDQALKPDDVVDAQTAAQMLSVPVDRIAVMVDDGLLEPVADRPGPVFPVANVLAARQVGG